MSIAGTQANLIVATLDLQLARLLRGAIAKNAAAALRLQSRRAELLTRKRIHPEPLIEPRKRIEPEPRFEPRKVIHPQPRVDACIVAPAPEQHASRETAGPLQPPWRSPLPEIPLQPVPKVKITVQQPDFIHKGLLLDFFI